MASVTLAGRDGIAVLSADRPPANAMDIELPDELVSAVGQLAKGSPPALVLAGHPGSFSAGLYQGQVRVVSVAGNVLLREPPGAPDRSEGDHLGGLVEAPSIGEFPIDLTRDPVELGARQRAGGRIHALLLLHELHIDRPVHD
jgi:hypothetical protein